MKRGQITIEYLLILVILITIFTSVSMDLMNFTTDSTLRIQTEELQKTHNYTLKNNIQSISLQAPGAVQTIAVTTPPDCLYNVTSGRITLNCTEGTPSENYTGTVIGNIPSSQNIHYEPQQRIQPGETGEVSIVKTGG